MTWLRHNRMLLLELSGEHLRQALLPIVAGLALALPLGWAAHRFHRIRGPLLAGVSVAYVVPSLAVFAVLPPLLGISFLSEANLLIALTVYAVATLTRYVADGLAAVDPAARSAADAVGFSPRQRLLSVELPLAGPVILAGLRVTAMSTISLTTVGALIGTRNIGYLLTDGYQRQITAEVVAGIVAVMIIALVVDQALAWAGRVAMPWQAQAQAQAVAK
ncbi:ABC transporter permease [Corynebacterium uberis]|uniref:ABC transporter permease n=1 Tax=Corynebacterium uberis TaxID=2883169 RepID=UPI001D09B582|nr:ABC transporter permease [Corynebacterium uberis]UDL75392.1 ABC transporter permease [Corynebacterium uberis]UDL79890.1 ABC transporter permease [Corynebacterium uberis]